MTYIVALIFMTILVVPEIFFEKKQDLSVNNYQMEYHMGWRGPGKPDADNDSSSESGLKATEDKLELENWMMDPTGWDANNDSKGTVKNPE